MLVREIFTESKDKFNGRYVFHETSLDVAIQIFKSGHIKGIYIDNPQAKAALQDELGADYGNYVYATTFKNHNEYAYYGVTNNEVMFVIDTHKLPHKGVYEPKYENGLFKIPNIVPLYAVVHVLIGGYEDDEDDRLHEVSSACMSHDIDFNWYDPDAYHEHQQQRRDTINHWRGQR